MFTYSWRICTAVAEKLPRRRVHPRKSQNVDDSGGMIPLRINTEPCALIWPTHLIPVIVYNPSGLDVKLPSWVKLPSCFTAYVKVPVSSNEGAEGGLL